MVKTFFRNLHFPKIIIFWEVICDEREFFNKASIKNMVKLHVFNGSFIKALFIKIIPINLPFAEN